MDCRWRRIELAISGRVAPSSCITSTTSHPPHCHSRRHLAANGEEPHDRRMAKRVYILSVSKLPLCLVVTPSHCVGSGALGFPHLAACWRTSKDTGDGGRESPQLSVVPCPFSGASSVAWAGCGWRAGQAPWRMFRPNLVFPSWDFGCRTCRVPITSRHSPRPRVRTSFCLRPNAPFEIRGQKIKAPGSPTSFPAHHHAACYDNIWPSVLLTPEGPPPQFVST